MPADEPILDPVGRRYAPQGCGCHADPLPDGEYLFALNPKCPHFARHMEDFKAANPDGKFIGVQRIGES